MHTGLSLLVAQAPIEFFVLQHDTPHTRRPSGHTRVRHAYILFQNVPCAAALLPLGPCPEITPNREMWWAHVSWRGAYLWLLLAAGSAAATQVDLLERGTAGEGCEGGCPEMAG